MRATLGCTKFSRVFYIQLGHEHQAVVVGMIDRKTNVLHTERFDSFYGVGNLHYLSGIVCEEHKIFLTDGLKNLFFAIEVFVDRPWCVRNAVSNCS